MATRNKSTSLGLALQGGASHGAYTWGVLDRLLEDKTIPITAVTGTSSGAFNAVLLADGLEKGSRQTASDNLRRGWMMMSEKATLKIGGVQMPTPFRSLEIPTPFGPMNYDKLIGTWPNLSHPLHKAFMNHAIDIPEKDFQKMGNKVAEILTPIVDFDALKRGKNIKLFVNAINADSQNHHIFTGSDLSVDAVCASCNLPDKMPSTRMPDGSKYWDGGYRLNPPVSPLYAKAKVSDVMVVLLNPHQTEVTESKFRQDQLVYGTLFSASAYEELNALDMRNRMIRDFHKAGMPVNATSNKYKEINVHCLNKEMPVDRGGSSKFNLDPDFLEQLHGEGHKAADAWLRANKQHLAQRSTFDIAAKCAPRYGHGTSEPSPHATLDATQ